MGLQGDSVCTLGRQVLFLSQQTLDEILKQHEQRPVALPGDRSIYFAEDVLHPLGFSRIDMMDASEYDGANVIQDLNLPIPQGMHERYDLVIDGGTLEHIFNFPAALENVMRMAKLGGQILLFTPANNQCGHGFYQFSPELFFRVLVPENGFELLRIYMTCDGQYFHVVDPISVHGRVELLSSKSAALMVHARKIAHVPDRIQPPQQSDYVTKWAEVTAKNAEPEKKQDGALKAFARARLSSESIAKISRALIFFRRKRNAWRWKRRSRLSNREFYVPVTKWTMTTSEAVNR